MDYRQILHKYWGFDDFRGVQREIIESIGSGRDTLGLMPTGGGKSITFQVPALAMEGICLVISPLIALMKDQVEHLREQGIKAIFIHSGLSHEEVLTALENCIFGNFKFLYVSPERFSSEIFRAKLAHMNVSFITVDEAHCISQWGYDFRPAYTRISEFRKALPHVPVLALTATATPKVVDDIQRQLLFAEPNVVRMSFARTNLCYAVHTVTSSSERDVEFLLQEHPGCAIVYTRSRKGAYELARHLVQCGVSATFYHAGMLHSEKTAHQQAWQRGEVRVMVATNAFGMGIDKADVRLVIHVDVPDSPEAYFQEAGRAGRDGKPADAILLYEPSVIPVLKRRVEEIYPPEDYVVKVYDDVCSYLQIAVGDGYGVMREFSLDEFCTRYRHFPVRAYYALQLLSRAGFLEWQDAEEGRSRVLLTASRDTLYKYAFSSEVDSVMHYLLRTFPGIFSEYVSFEEDTIATSLNLTIQQVTEDLIALSRLRVISYIPRRYIPHIRFTQRRLDTDEIILPLSVYDDRKAEYQQRITTMIAYLTTEGCRSQFLLQYFGERQTQPCGCCDYCTRKAVLPEEIPYEKIRAEIIQYFSTHPRVALPDLHLQTYPDRMLMEVLHRMLAEEELIEENCALRLNISHKIFETPK